jgi:phosphoribosylglycinamide formyltransferase-1
VEASDTPDDLARKVHALEYAHFPRVIASLVKKIAEEIQQFENK